MINKASKFGKVTKFGFCDVAGRATVSIHGKLDV